MIPPSSVAYHAAFTDYVARGSGATEGRSEPKVGLSIAVCCFEYSHTCIRKTLSDKGIIYVLYIGDRTIPHFVHVLYTHFSLSLPPKRNSRILLPSLSPQERERNRPSRFIIFPTKSKIYFSYSPDQL
jgi:hypothetical protein